MSATFDALFKSADNGKAKISESIFVCVNNLVFNYPYEMVNAFRRLEYAKKIMYELHNRQLDDAQKEWNKNIESKISKHSVEGFYLVHESLFDEY